MDLTLEKVAAYETLQLSHVCQHYIRKNKYKYKCILQHFFFYFLAQRERKIFHMGEVLLFHHLTTGSLKAVYDKKMLTWAFAEL